MKLILVFLLFLIDLNASTQLGIDVLENSNFRILKDKKVGLLTNHSGRNSKGISTVEIFKKQTACKLSVIFVPEHGYYTSVPAGKHVENETLQGIPVLSLYGKNRRPSKEFLDQCDVVVIDLQDVGVRSYTFISTIFEVMDACAEFGRPVVVLDRPNPISGVIVDGNLVEEEFTSFVSRLPVSYIHGCTVGELAEMINGEKWLSNGRDCMLEVIKMKGWSRWNIWEDTDLNWIPTSPHVPTVDALRGMAVLGITGELGIISIGIGTTSPFQYLGKPGFDTEKFTSEFLKINPSARNINDGIILPGMKLIKARYRPFYGMHKGKDCDGFLLKFTPSNEFQPYTYAIDILRTLMITNPSLFSIDGLNERSINMFNKVTGTDLIWKELNKKGNRIQEFSQMGLIDYLNIRKKYLLY